MMEEGGELTDISVNESRGNEQLKKNNDDGGDPASKLLNNFFQGAFTVGSKAKSAAAAASAVMGKAAKEASTSATEKLKMLKINKDENHDQAGSGSGFDPNKDDYGGDNGELAGEDGKRKNAGIAKMTSAVMTTASKVKVGASVAWQGAKNSTVGKLPLNNQQVSSSTITSSSLNEIAAENGPLEDD